LPKKEEEEIRNIEAYVKDLRKDMDKRLSELKVELDDIQQKAAKTVSEQPMLALGVAFVAGMAMGIALSQSGD
jgi:ElaB/YqjD/DUF883 family membrane-anchored ribosome-binding protein